MRLSAHKHTIVTLFFLAVFVACVLYLSANPQLTGTTGSEPHRTDIALGEGWTTADGTPVSLDRLNDIPGFAERGATISCVLPQGIEAGMELNFMSTNLTFHLFYDDTEVYAFDPERAEQDMPYTSRFNFSPLSPEDSGKTATIQIQPVYRENTARLTDMRVCETSTYIQDYVRSHALTLIESVLVFFIGLVIIALHIALRNIEHGNINLLALGVTFLLLGTWSGAVTTVVQLVTGITASISALEYMSLLFVPLPIVCVTSSLLQPKRRGLYNNIAFVAAVIAIGSTAFLSVTQHLDMHRLLPISHAQLLLCAAIGIVEAVSSFRTHGRQAVRDVLKSNNAIVMAFLVFMLCGIADFVSFTTPVHNTGDVAFFIRHGLFAFSVVLAIEASRASLSYISRAKYADTIELIAYTDSLTQIGNRAAWKIMREKMDAALAAGTMEDVAVCQFDVNFLKKVNDTYGHAAGDRYIKHAAETIKRSFGSEGSCFRTGGDEFTAIIAGTTVNERVSECEKLFQTSLAEQGQGDEVPLSIALGYAYVSESESRTIRAAQQIADERMYANKRAMKAERVD